MGDKPVRLQLRKPPDGRQIDASRVADAPATTRHTPPVRRPSSPPRALTNVRRVNPPPAARKDPVHEALKPVIWVLAIGGPIVLTVAAARFLWIHRVVIGQAAAALAVLAVLFVVAALRSDRGGKSGGCPPPCRGC